MNGRHRQHALQQAIRWSWVVPWQIGRMKEAQRVAVEAQRQWQGQHGFRLEAYHRYPMHRLEAEGNFVLIAARNLVRALTAFGDRAPAMPEGLAETVVLLRNCLEHFEDQYGRSWQRFRDEHPGQTPDAYSWGPAGTLLGGVVLAEELAAVATDIHKELLTIEDRDF